MDLMWDVYDQLWVIFDKDLIEIFKSIQYIEIVFQFMKKIKCRLCGTIILPKKFFIEKLKFYSS